jgi:hypothetical protein
VSACESNGREALSEVVEDGEGDAIYAIDRISEMLLVSLFEQEIALLAAAAVVLALLKYPANTLTI